MKKTIIIITTSFALFATFSSCKKDTKTKAVIPQIDSTLVTLYNTVTINNQYPGGAAFIDLDKGELYDMTSAGYPDAIDNQDKIDAVYATFVYGFGVTKVFSNPNEFCSISFIPTNNLCTDQYNGISKWTTKNNTQFELTSITYSQLLQIKYNFQLDSAYNKAVSDKPISKSSVIGLESGQVYRFKTNFGKGLFVVSTATGTDTTLGELVISILYLKDK
jgi:hypothetical protein